MIPETMITPKPTKIQVQERKPIYAKYPLNPIKTRNAITTMLFTIPVQLLSPDHLNNPLRDSINLSIL